MKRKREVGDSGVTVKIFYGLQEVCHLSGQERTRDVSPDILRRTVDSPEGLVHHSARGLESVRGRPGTPRERFRVSEGVSLTEKEGPQLRSTIPSTSGRDGICETLFSLLIDEEPLFNS